MHYYKESILIQLQHLFLNEGLYIFQNILSMLDESRKLLTWNFSLESAIWFDVVKHKK